MRKLLLLSILYSVACLAAADDWGPLQFLLGTWAGEGGGQPGQAAGKFTFTPDLQGRVLIRRNFAEYPAANGKPAFRHDDLMIVHRDGEAKVLKATYYDNEGHVIHYVVQPSSAGAVFVSEGSPVRYRLTYTRQSADKIQTKFEIAPPGKEFASYVEATVHREK